MVFTTGDEQEQEQGVWLYVLEWLSQRGVWVVYGMSERYSQLRSDVKQLERLGYRLNRRRVRHWLQSQG